MKQIIKKLLPKRFLRFIRPIYHGSIALMASSYFGHPSQKLLVVGITGTAGKSTTAAMLAEILNYSGKKCGYITTVNFFDGKTDYINKHGMSMPGGWLLQKQLRQMLDNGCGYAIVECTSEGLVQNRHFGIKFDAAIFTNLTEAHLEAHGSFENYKVAKGRLFAELGKQVYGTAKTGGIPKTIIANLDSPYAEYFLSFKVDKKIGVTLDEAKKYFQLDQVMLISDIKAAANLDFAFEHTAFTLNMFGEFNAVNAGLAAAAASVFGVSLEQSAAALKTFIGVPGRMEPIQNNKGIQILVDYGCEPSSFEAAIKAASKIPHKKLIHVFGSTGGHRDVAKRSLFGKISAQFADKIIITNDDVYDSDPEKIASDIAEGVRQVAHSTGSGQESKKLKVKSVETILDRRLAIANALATAEKDDLVLITGKGSEQFLVLPGNKRIAWDDRVVVRECLKNLR